MTLEAAQSGINTFQDILDALERHPELQEALWRHIATPRLLNLPAIAEELLRGQGRIEERQDKLEEAISLLAEGHARIEARQERLEERQERLEERQERLEERQERTEARQERMEERQERTEARQERMEERQDRMEARQERLEARQERTEERQERTEIRQDHMEARQDRMEADLKEIRGAVTRLTGTVYERRAASRARRRARSLLGMTAPVVVHLTNDMTRDAAGEIADLAETEGALSAEDAEELEEIDLIILDRDSGRYAAGEISVTLDADDAVRARTRARILAAATSMPVTPILIGAVVLDECQKEIEESEVVIFKVSDQDKPKE